MSEMRIPRIFVLIICASASPQIFASIEHAYFTVTTTVKTEELKKKTISTRLREHPSIIEVNANAAFVGELTRKGFRYVPKGGEIIIDVSASHGVETTAMVHSYAPFRHKLENESDDVSYFAFSAIMDGKPIWEGTIRIPSEELEGVYTHVCIKKLLDRFDTTSAGEDDCD